MATVSLIITRLGRASSPTHMTCRPARSPAWRRRLRGATWS